MAITNINVGTTPNDGTGDPIRDAFIKCNDNFTDLDTTKQDTLTNPVTGTGANGQVAFFNGATTQIGDNGLFWDNTNKRLGVGTNTPGYGVSHIGSIGVASFFSQRDFGANTLSQLTQRASYIGYTFNDGTNGIAMGANGVGGYIQGFQGTLANPSVRQIVLQSFGGNVGIGINPQARLDVRAQGALSTDITFRVRNSADTANLISIDGRGQTTIDSLRNVQSLFLKSSPTTSGDFNEIVFGVTGSNSRFATIQSIHVNPASNLRTHLTFNTTGTAFGEGMRLTDNKNVLIGTTTDIPSSKLTVGSTTQGFLPPRMTNAQRLAIASPAVGLMVYCTDATEGLYVNKSTGWTFII
jgi:hypothetical protein